MSETTTVPMATLVGNFLRRVGLDSLPQTFGNRITLVLHYGIPFFEFEKEYSSMIVRLSILEASLNCRRVIKNTLAVKFLLDEPDDSIEVYFKQDGTFHVQVYEHVDVLDYIEDTVRPPHKSARVIWNGVDLGWFPNLDNTPTLR